MAQTYSLAISDFQPDGPDYNNNDGSDVMLNVVPRTAKSYGPMPSMAVYSGALTARCQGAVAELDSAGNVFNFAGDATKLYRLASGSISWVDVSRLAGGAYACPADALWKFAFMNGRVIATNYIDDVQGFLIDSAANFSQLSAGAPKARYCAVIKNFLMLANTTDAVNGPQPQCVWWSALNDPPNFPTLNTAAAAAVFSWGAPRLSALGIAVVLLVGISRVYLGVHWPTDVLAGWALGAAVGAIVVALSRLRYLR